jgi:hypothetical protein
LPCQFGGNIRNYQHFWIIIVAAAGTGVFSVNKGKLVTAYAFSRFFLFVVSAAPFTFRL